MGVGEKLASFRANKNKVYNLLLRYFRKQPGHMLGRCSETINSVVITFTLAMMYHLNKICLLLDSLHGL